jgi:hypothetical protein
MSDWNEISQEEATRHPLYGVRGWLLVFGLGWVLRVILVGMMAANFTAGFEIAAPDVQLKVQGLLGFILTSCALTALFTAFVLAMMLTKWNHFRVAATVVILANYPLKLIIAAMWDIPNLKEFALEAFLTQLAYCIIWPWYLQMSRRVRVTFERMVPTNDVEHRTDQAPAAFGRQVS